MAPGAYVLLAEATNLGATERNLTVAAANLTGLEVRLDDGAAVGGVVLDARGRPVEGALVWASAQPVNRAPLIDRSALAARSGAEGRFLLRGLPPGSTRLSASHPEHGRAVAESIVTASGESKVLELRLESGSYLEGFVRRDGKPAAGARVVAGWRDPDGFGYNQAAVGTDGRFRVGPVRAGPVTLVASPRGEGALVVDTGQPHQARLEVAEGEARPGVQLELPASSLAITGRVRHPGGGPLEGARITAEPELGPRTWIIGESIADTLSGRDGSFSFPELDPGPHTLRFEHAGYPTRTLSAVAAGTAGLEVEPARPATIRGLVTRPDGRPAERFSVRALRHDDGSDADREGGSQRNQAVSQAGGAFAIPGLPAGRYDVEAVTAGGLVGRAATLSLGIGGQSDVRIRLGEAASLALRISDFATGKPMAGVRVVAEAGGHLLASASTDSAGLAILTGLAPGAQVELTAPADVTFGYTREKLHVAAPEGNPSPPLRLRLYRKSAKVWLAETPRGGLGLHLERTGTGMLVKDVLPARPAAAAGVLPGDIIVAVDGTNIDGLGPLGVIELMRGHPGTAVTLDLSTRAGPRSVGADPERSARPAPRLRSRWPEPLTELRRPWPALPVQPPAAQRHLARPPQPKNRPGRGK